MPETKSTILGVEDAKKFKAAMGQWEWLDGEPWVNTAISQEGMGRYRAVITKAEKDEDSMCWTFNGKPLLFGRDRTVLETWMDEDYVKERQAEGGDGPPRGARR